MRPDEIVTAVAGTAAAVSFVVDYLRWLARTGDEHNPLVTISALGILALVMILLASVLFGWPAWVIRDAMGILAAVVFPFAQVRMHQLRRLEAQRR